MDSARSTTRHPASPDAGERSPYPSSGSRRFWLIALFLLGVASVPSAAQPPAPSPPPASHAPLPAAPPRREFSPDAPPGTSFAWTSQPTDGLGNAVGTGLAYVWSLPASYQPGTSYDLLIVVHGVGKDAGWGHAAIDPLRLGKDLIVISPAGTSVLAQGVRSFSDAQADYLAFREFMLEMTRVFPADRIVLFGFEQGGSFALSFAAEFPSLAEGVVVQGSTPWFKDQEQDSPGMRTLRQIPIVLLQGTADETMPYAAAAAARDRFLSFEHRAVWLRPLYGCGHDPDAQRVGEAVDWCLGMQHQEAQQVVDTARRLLTVARPDKAPNLACDAAPALGAVCQLLRRVMGDTEDNTAHLPLGEVEPEVRAAAKRMLGDADAAVTRHLTRLAPEAGKPGDFVLNGKPWLGHLLALREDCQGVPAFEAFSLNSGFGQRFDSQLPAAAAYEQARLAQTPKERFEGLLDALPGCFLRVSCTPGLVSQMQAWRDNAAELGLSEESLERFETILLLDRSWRDGLAQYWAMWGAR